MRMQHFEIIHRHAYVILLFNSIYYSTTAFNPYFNKKKQKTDHRTNSNIDTHTRNLRDVWKDVLKGIQSPLCTKRVKNICIFLERTKDKKQFSSNNQIHLSYLGSGKAYFFFFFPHLCFNINHCAK